MKPALAIALTIAASAVVVAGPGDAAGAQAAWVAACGGRGGVQHESNRSVVDRPAYLAALGVQSGRHLLSARVTTVSSYIRTGDIALLYEHALVNGGWLVALGAGPGVRYYEAMPPYDWQFPVPEHDRPDFGLALSLQAVTRKHAHWSGGAIVFGSVAGDQSFYGGGLVVQFGSLGARRQAGEP